jgi:anti-sigma regulatory factor (Ser/Thr protein kinase)
MPGPSAEKRLGSVSLAVVHVSLRAPVAIGVVSATRRYVVEGLKAMVDDEDGLSRIAIALHELFENAVKYGHSGAVELDVTLSRGEDGPGLVKIRTSNRACRADREEMVRVIAEIAADHDPVALYDRFIRRSVVSEGSGLGLVRIRAESDMTLSCEMGEDEVIVVAEGSCGLREGE